MFRAPRTKQQVKLFVEQRLVLGAWPTKENEGFGEGAATGHDLRAALRQEVQGGELLIDTDRIVRTRHRDSTAQANGGCPGGASGEDEGRRRDGIVRPVVLADGEDVEANLIGEFDLRDQVAKPFAGADPNPCVGVRSHGAEREYAEFHSGQPRVFAVSRGTRLIVASAPACRAPAATASARVSIWP